MRRGGWILLGVLGALGLAGLPSAAQKRTRRPNVLVIFADQWRAQAFGYAGDQNVKTPNLDRFARESLNFTRAVSSVPVCCPTRASFLTGQRALTHGVFMNDVPLSPDAVTIGKEFGRAGYDTGFIGKWHVDGHGRSAFIPRERRHGFDYWRALECTHNYNKSLFYGDTPQVQTWEGYDTFAQTDDAVRYVQARGGSEKPFFLVLSWGPPHEPYQTAPERYRQMYSPGSLKLRENVPASAEKQAREDLAGYYAHCTALDDSFGKLWQAVKAAGIEENTVLLFTSDHGDMLRSHGFQKKQQPYEESARVPLLVHYPRQYGRRGERTDAAIVTEDLMPTLLRLAGLPVPKTVQGRDFSGCLTCQGDPADGVQLISCQAPFGQWPRSRGGREYRAIRTDRYTYARDLNGPWLLYDNREDPYQQQNLVADPKAGRQVSKLDARLTALLKKNGDEFRPAPDYIRQWGYTVDATGTVPYTP